MGKLSEAKSLEHSTMTGLTSHTPSLVELLLPMLTGRDAKKNLNEKKSIERSPRMHLGILRTRTVYLYPVYCIDSKLFYAYCVCCCGYNIITVAWLVRVATTPGRGSTRRMLCAIRDTRVLAHAQCSRSTCTCTLSLASVFIRKTFRPPPAI